MNTNDIYSLSEPQILQQLGLRFRQYRIAVGLTQEDLAKKAGVSVSTIHKFETGTIKNMTVVNLFSLMRHTGILSNADTIIMEQPENPYYRNIAGKKRVKK